MHTCPQLRIPAAGRRIINSMTSRKRILFIAPQPFFEVRGTPIATRDMLNILSQEFDIDLLTYPFGSDEPVMNVRHIRSAALGIKKVGIGASLQKIVLA